VDECDAEALAGCGDRATRAGQSSSDDNKVGGNVVLLERATVNGWGK
jgi:hypothetical protein